MRMVMAVIVIAAATIGVVVMVMMAGMGRRKQPIGLTGGQGAGPHQAGFDKIEFLAHGFNPFMRLMNVI